MLHSAHASVDLDTGLLGIASKNAGDEGDAGEYVLELATNRLWRVGESLGYGHLFVAQPYLSWYTPSVNGSCVGQLVVRWRTPH